MKETLFTTKASANLEFSDFMTLGRDGKDVYAEENNGTFRVSFQPWDPQSSKFKRSDWLFRCNRDNEQTGFPTQICGELSCTDPTLVEIIVYPTSTAPSLSFPLLYAVKKNS